ncbi:hypothetical protein RAS2_29190 [Phycisphaerae bacterium RAS2]|nr:hypothetical protein RAS2_29190 [Phycisphaerae bacterium RAS2]
MRTVPSQFSEQLPTKPATHVFCISFEDRCLAYPRILAQLKLPGNSHTLLCLVPPDDGVGGELQKRRAENKSHIYELLPAIRTGSISELVRQLMDAPPPDSIYLDISAMPRRAIFDILIAIADQRFESTRVFILHADPEAYHHGALQTPDPGMSPYFDAQLPRAMKTSVLMFPGFDLAYSLVALTYIEAATGPHPHTKWLFSFPGRTYAFYQRARETHLHLVGNSEVSLYPQYHIQLAFERLRTELFGSELIVLVPLGPRITCVSIFLACLWARQCDRHVEVLVPRTGKYTSLRSSGSCEPMIEEITPILRTSRQTQ